MTKKPAHDNGTLSRLFALGRLMKSRIEADSPLPLSHVETLRFVSEHKGPTMHELALFHRITAPSATALVAELVKGGYLVRHGDTADRRHVRVLLTPAGARLLKSVGQKRERVLEELLAEVSAKDRAELNRILDHILTHNASV